MRVDKKEIETLKFLSQYVGKRDALPALIDMLNKIFTEPKYHNGPFLGFGLYGIYQTGKNIEIMNAEYLNSKLSKKQKQIIKEVISKHFQEAIEIEK